ncbi:MAG: hypothetical protein DI582_08325 [Azospirillum brasilense]|nr:MAG: hypothetical protein DI582_08325 [Azospirillum brasilense]
MRDVFHEPVDRFSLLTPEQQLAVRYQLQAIEERTGAAGVDKEALKPLLAKTKNALTDHMLNDGHTAKFMLNEYRASVANLAGERSGSSQRLP